MHGKPWTCSRLCLTNGLIPSNQPKLTSGIFMMSAKLKDETLIQLLELASTEERFYIEAHQKRIQFFVVLNSTVFAGCIVGLSRAAETDIGPLILAPLLIIVSSQFGKIGVKAFMFDCLRQSYSARNWNRRWVLTRCSALIKRRDIGSPNLS